MFSLGFLGTGHCMGMCGPLVLAVPARHKNITAHLLYHAGRVLTYTAIGTAIAAISKILRTAAGNSLSNVATVEVFMSLLAALFLLLFGLVRMGFIGEPKWMSVASPAHLPGFDSVAKRAGAKGGLSVFLWGLMLGTLPCGLSFAAFAKALSASSPAEGGLWVFFFGLGTLPGLLILGTAGSRFFSKKRRLFDLLSGALMIVMGFSLATNALSTYIT